MQIAPIPDNEEERVAALEEYKILDTPCEEIFDDITQLAATICQTPISLISLIDRDRQFLKSNYGLPVKETSRDASFCAHTILGSDIMEIKDAEIDERFSDNPFVVGDPGIRFYAGSPLTTPEGLKVGSLCVIDRKPKKLTDEQKDILNRLSKVIITVFELKKAISMDLSARFEMAKKMQSANYQLEKSLKEQKQNNNTLTLFSKMNGMLQSCISYEEAFSVIKNYCQKIFPDSSGTLYLISSSREHMELSLEWNQPSSLVKFFEPEDCWALRRGQYYVVDNPKIDVICAHFKNRKKDLTHICLPLNAQSEMFGMLCLENISSLTASEARLLYAVRMAEQIALCLANIKLRQILRQQSTCDPLTGLYNRRYLAEIFKRKSSEAELTDNKLIAILIDIDYFKKFNDTYGHDAGDLVLTTLADLLKKHVKEQDIVFRLGGEEFLLLLENVSASAIKDYAEDVRRAVHDVKLSYHNQDLGPLTISLGVAVFPKHGKTLDALLIAADKALYYAKENGRDQVVLYESLKHKD